MLTCEPTTIAFRSTGSVPVPVRKGASCANSGLVLPRHNSDLRDIRVYTNPLSPSPLGPATTQSNPVQRPNKLQGDWG